MIGWFGDKDTEALYGGARAPRFDGFTKQAERKLQILDSAVRLEDLMGLSSNRFEPLTGDRAGQYSLHICKNWRLCFEWRENAPSNVAIVDLP